EHVVVKKDDTIVYMNCDNGLPAAAALRTRSANRIFATARNILSVESTRRTIAANGGGNVEIVAGHGAPDIAGAMSFDTVAIRIPHEKLALIQLLYDALRILKPGGLCYIAGATNEGIKTAAKLLERAFGNATLLAYESGNRILSAAKIPDATMNDVLFGNPFLPSDSFREIDGIFRGESLRIFSRPGVFSWHHIDEATQILANHIGVPRSASVLDLGCGSGALGIVASRLSDGGPLVMVDSDVEAVRAAAKSAEADGIANY